MTNKLIKALEYALKNCDKIPAEELAEYIKPHTKEIISIADTTELCLAEMA